MTGVERHRAPGDAGTGEVLPLLPTFPSLLALISGSVPLVG